MRNSRTENIAEHSFQTALIAHALACIEKKIYNKKVNPDRAAVFALFHETAEVLTGDLPTPIKYFSAEMRNAYKKVEKSAEQRLLKSLPDELRDELFPMVQAPDSLEKELVKYADKLAALIKCIEEKSSNNAEFNEAYDSTLKTLKEYKSDSVNYFLKHFIKAFYLSLDGLTDGIGE